MSERSFCSGRPPTYFQRSTAVCRAPSARVGLFGVTFVSPQRGRGVSPEGRRRRHRSGSAVPLVTKGRNEGEGNNTDINYFLGISSGVLAADFEDMPAEDTGDIGGFNHPISGTTPIVMQGTESAVAWS